MKLCCLVKGSCLCYHCGWKICEECYSQMFKQSKRSYSRLVFVLDDSHFEYSYKCKERYELQSKSAARRKDNSFKRTR